MRLAAAENPSTAVDSVDVQVEVLTPVMTDDATEGLCSPCMLWTVPSLQHILIPTGRPGHV